MTSNESHERSGRETRLLVLIVVVSLAVLLILARFRFPAATLSVAPPAPSPLANLAGRVAFHDLGDAMTALVGRAFPRIAIVQLEAVRDPASSTGRVPSRGVTPLVESPEPAASGPIVLAPALRVQPELALLYVPTGFGAASLLGLAEPIEVVATDLKREVALVRIPPAMEARTEGADSFGGFGYLGAITATENGPTVAPIFFGRVAAIVDERWPAAVIDVGNVDVPPGSFLFSVEGRLVGLVVRTGQRTAIVPPTVLNAVVRELTAAAGVAP